MKSLSKPLFFLFALLIFLFCFYFLFKGIKTYAKPFLIQIKHKIYNQAQKHNPKGDVMPDQIDDRLLHEVKKRF
ncbi:MAG: hypothetical protein GF335_00195 [Candidatus Moranbacteria bacterium]|nr:hypothetical protein [Candidatus Moranbacteria bacterium]